MFAVTIALASVSCRLAAWMALFSLLVLVARVYIGVHYPADVLGGAALAAAGGWATLRLACVPTVDRWIMAVLDQLARLHLAASTAGQPPGSRAGSFT